MRRESLIITSFVCVTIVAAAALVSHAGPLDPPAGPVASTYKTLHQVEPRTPISQDDIPLSINIPGSYYLTENLFAVGFGDDIITINASNVTLDMRGFTIDGATEVSLADHGIIVPFDTTNITIHNGVVRDCQVKGVAAQPADNSRFFDLRVENNADDGLNAGVGCAVTNCVAVDNGVDGITCASGVVEGCAATGNGEVGIIAGGSITGCSALNNGTDGILAFDGAIVSECSARNNEERGIALFPGAQATSCAAFSNGIIGIHALQGNQVSNCTLRSNGVDGILAGDRCLITGNNCFDNGVTNVDGAGIHVSANNFGGTRISDNNCANNWRGIDVDSQGNIIVRNTAPANFSINYSIVGGNDVGTIQNTPIGAGAWDNLQ